MRKDDPSVLPEPGEPLQIGLSRMSEKEWMELADALLESSSVTYLELGRVEYTKKIAEVVAEYVRTSKRLQSIHWIGNSTERELQQRDEMLCYFLPAFQESTSLKELHVSFPLTGGPSNLAFENMLTNTQSIRSLTLSREMLRLEEETVAAASLRDHPRLQKLCLREDRVDLTVLETVLLSDTSKITQLDIHRDNEDHPIRGLTSVLQALARRPVLTKLGLHNYRLGRYHAELLGRVLHNTPSLQSLDLSEGTLWNAGFTELAPALYHNTSIKVLNISGNNLDIADARLLRDILCRNKTITALEMSGNIPLGQSGGVGYIADGLGGNSTLLEISLGFCDLSDEDVSILAQTLGSRNATLQKLILDTNNMTSMSVGLLLEMMEHNSCRITDLDLQCNNTIGNEGASLFAGSLRSNALPNLTRLCLSGCAIGDDGFTALMSALEQNTSLLHLELNHCTHLSERAFLGLAESLPEIKVLQRVCFIWCSSFAPAMPLLLAGLRKNTSLFCFHVVCCAISLLPPTSIDTAKCDGGWMQEIERLGYRNRFLPLLRAPKVKLLPSGVWPHALARVAALPDVVFEVLRSKPSLVLSEDTECMEAANGTGKRKRGDE